MKTSLGIATVTVVLLGTALAVGRSARVSPSLSREAAAQEAQGAAQGAHEAQAGAQAAPQRVPAAAQTAEEAIAAHQSASRGPLQPLPFSHRFHAGELRIDCMYCHAGTERSAMGVVPAVEVCMGCHRVAGSGLEPIEQLRQYSARGEPIPWKWVHRLPDFVQFRHQPHLRNGIACQSCHGPVEEMDRVYQWAPLTMGWCLDCHRREPAETDVATDHLLSRAGPPPPAPEGRQPKSLYPVTIDQKYGAYRAPIDCLTCHY